MGPSVTFNDITLNNLHPRILVTSIRRPLRQGVKRRKLAIPGRAGSWDFGPGPPEDFIIEVDVTLRGINHTDLRGLFRSLENWLAGKGPLVFSDEPEKVYQAQVAETVMMTASTLSLVQSGTIRFECDA